MKKWFVKYLKHQESSSRWRFIAESVGLMIVASMVFTAVALALGAKQTTGGYYIKEYGLYQGILMVVLLAPPVETFLCQYLPIKFISLFTQKRWLIYLFSVGLFVGIHLHVGFSGIFSTLVPGIILVRAFLICNDDPERSPFIDVTLIHALVNLALGTLTIITY